jgi:hypothetical protein
MSRPTLEPIPIALLNAILEAIYQAVAEGAAARLQAR